MKRVSRQKIGGWTVSLFILVRCSGTQSLLPTVETQSGQLPSTIGTPSDPSSPASPTDPGTGGTGDSGAILPPPNNSSGDTGFIAPPARYLNCDQQQNALLSAGQNILLNFVSSDPSQTPQGTLVFQIVSGNAPALANLGSVSQGQGSTGVYTAPSSVASSFQVEISAHASTETVFSQSPCMVTLLADGDFGVADDGHTQGLVGQIYSLPVNTSQLPDFSIMTPVTTILAPNINIPDHNWSDGFPGAPSTFIEWFGIDFQGKIYIPATGQYQFRTDSDDGSILLIDNVVVTNNDGVHAIATVLGPVVTLTQGFHTFEEKYYQGPRYRIADMVYWRSGSDPNAQWEIIPPEALFRP